MQQGKQPLRARLQLLAWLTLNAGKHTANQPARLAHLDDGNDRAILVQGNEGPAQIVRLGHRGTPSIGVSDEIAILAARPIASLRWRKTDSNHRSHLRTGARTHEAAGSAGPAEIFAAILARASPRSMRGDLSCRWCSLSASASSS